MKIEFTNNINCVVTREAGDRKPYTESALLHAIKKALNDRGHDLVKRIMAKDGHMVGGDTGPHYLRDRKRRYCIWDDAYAVRLLHETYKAEGRVVLVCSTLDGLKVDITELCGVN